MTFGKLPFGEMPCREFTELSFCKFTFGELPFGEMSVSELPRVEEQSTRLHQRTVALLFPYDNLLSIELDLKIQHHYETFFIQDENSLLTIC